MRTIRGVILAATLAATGCRLTDSGPAATTMARIRGELQTSEAVSLDRAFRAAQLALEELEFSIDEAGKDAMSAKVTGRGHDDRPAVVRMQRVAEEETRIGVRVGTIGSEHEATMLLEAMRRHFVQPERFVF